MMMENNVVKSDSLRPLTLFVFQSTGDLCDPPPPVVLMEPQPPITQASSWKHCIHLTLLLVQLTLPPGINTHIVWFKLGPPGSYTAL